MAKAYEGYNMLKGGSIDSAFIDLTGGATIKIDFGDLSSQQDIALYERNPSGSLFGKLKHFFDNGYLLGAATEGTEITITNSNLIKGHAYSIIDIVSYDDNHLLQLKNPWGRLVTFSNSIGMER